MVYIHDCETIINCYLAIFENYQTEEQHIFLINKHTNDFEKLMSFLKNNIQNNDWHVTYNGNAFDYQILEKLMKEYNVLKNYTDGERLAKYIYDYAQKTIEKSNNNEYLEFYPNNFKINQIDIFKTNHWNNPNKYSSLKWLQYMIDYPNIEEMEQEHYIPIQDDQLDKLIFYCINDVKSTKKVFDISKDILKLRKTLSNEYGINLYSSSEPTISKELFLFFLSDKLKMDKNEIKKLRTRRDSVKLSECILPYVRFNTIELKKIHNFFNSKSIKTTKDKLSYSFTYKNVKIKLGLGGTHGAVSSGIYVPNEHELIKTIDVISYYPNLIIRNQFCPEHLPKKEFCEQYEWFYNERRKLSKKDPKNYVLKIILNSSFGLSGDENSFLLDKKLFMQTTLNGQLLLLMLFEDLCNNIPQIKPLMINTDGAEFIISKSYTLLFNEICSKWEKLTQLELEHDEYSRMIIADVNSYIAINKSGIVKCKGRFQWEDFDKYKISVLHKNKSFLVIPKALYEYFINGVIPEDYVNSNKNIFDFCGGVKSKGDWRFETREFEKGELKIKKLKKIVRYFVSNSGIKLMKVNKDGREIQIEAGEWKQTIANKIDIGKPFEQYDINKKYYLQSIYKEINNIENIVNRETTQLELF